MVNDIQKVLVGAGMEIKQKEHFAQVNETARRQEKATARKSGNAAQRADRTREGEKRDEETKEGKAVSFKERRSKDAGAPGFWIWPEEAGEVLGVPIDERGTTQTGFTSALNKAKRKWTERYAIYTGEVDIRLWAQRYYSEVGGALLYACSGWTLSKEMANRLEGGEGWCWGEMLHHPKRKPGEEPEEYRRERYTAARAKSAELKMPSFTAR